MLVINRKMLSYKQVHAIHVCLLQNFGVNQLQYYLQFICKEDKYIAKQRIFSFISYSHLKRHSNTKSSVQHPVRVKKKFYSIL